MSALTLTPIPRRQPGACCCSSSSDKAAIIGISVTLFVVLAVGGRFLPRKYVASAQVTVDSRSPRPPVRGSEVEVVRPSSEDIIGTEMAVLASRQLITKVVAR